MKVDANAAKPRSASLAVPPKVYNEDQSQPYIAPSNLLFISTPTKMLLGFTSRCKISLSWRKDSAWATSTMYFKPAPSSSCNYMYIITCMYTSIKNILKIIDWLTVGMLLFRRFLWKTSLARSVSASSVTIAMSSSSFTSPNVIAILGCLSLLILHDTLKA